MYIQYREKREEDDLIPRWSLHRLLHHILEIKRVSQTFLHSPRVTKIMYEPQRESQRIGNAGLCSLGASIKVIFGLNESQIAEDAREPNLCPYISRVCNSRGTQLLDFERDLFLQAQGLMEPVDLKVEEEQ